MKLRYLQEICSSNLNFPGKSLGFYVGMFWVKLGQVWLFLIESKEVVFKCSPTEPLCRAHSKAGSTDVTSACKSGHLTYRPALLYADHIAVLWKYPSAYIIGLLGFHLVKMTIYTKLTWPTGISWKQLHTKKCGKRWLHVVFFYIKASLSAISPKHNPMDKITSANGLHPVIMSWVIVCFKPPHVSLTVFRNVKSRLGLLGSPEGTQNGTTYKNLWSTLHWGLNANYFSFPN